MADLSLSSSPSLVARLVAGLRTVGEALALLVTARSRVAAIERLIRIPDEELAARGTTRERELNRILNGRALV